MDAFKQVGKYLRKDRDETAHNTRRIQENFPLIERKLDILAGDQSYHMEFPLGNNKKNFVSLTLKVKPDNCCDCEPGAQTGVRDCIGYWGSFTPPDGTMQQALYIEPLIQTGTNFNYGYNSPFFYHIYQTFPDIGGYTINPGGGIIVPVDGMYSVLFRSFITTTTDADSFLITAILQNGVIISKKTYSVSKGNLTLGSSQGKAYYQYAVCVPLHAGDTIGTGLQGSMPAWIVQSGTDISTSTRINLLGLGFGTLLGFVFDNITKAPIASATVSYSGGFGGSTTTDQYGAYVFDALRPATYSVTASAGGYISMVRDINVIFDDLVNLDFNLTPIP